MADTVQRPNLSTLTPGTRVAPPQSFSPLLETVIQETERARPSTMSPLMRSVIEETPRQLGGGREISRIVPPVPSGISQVGSALGRVVAPLARTVLGPAGYIAGATTTAPGTLPPELAYGGAEQRRQLEVQPISPRADVDETFNVTAPVTLAEPPQINILPSVRNESFPSANIQTPAPPPAPVIPPSISPPPEVSVPQLPTNIAAPIAPANPPEPGAPPTPIQTPTPVPIPIPVPTPTPIQTPTPVPIPVPTPTPPSVSRTPPPTPPPPSGATPPAAPGLPIPPFLPGGGGQEEIPIVEQTPFAAILPSPKPAVIYPHVGTPQNKFTRLLEAQRNLESVRSQKQTDSLGVQQKTQSELSTAQTQQSIAAPTQITYNRQVQNQGVAQNPYEFRSSAPPRVQPSPTLGGT